MRQNRSLHACNGHAHLGGASRLQTGARYRRKANVRSTLPQTTADRPERAPRGLDMRRPHPGLNAAVCDAVGLALPTVMVLDQAGVGRSWRRLILRARSRGAEGRCLALPQARHKSGIVGLFGNPGACTVG
jgi:hypothetical protein